MLTETRRNKILKNKNNLLNFTIFKTCYLIKLILIRFRQHDGAMFYKLNLLQHEELNEFSYKITYSCNVKVTAVRARISIIIRISVIK